MITLGEIAGLISIVSFAPYFYQTIRGTVRPERITWFIWTVLQVIAVVSQASAGGHDSLWFPLVGAVCAATIFILSIFKGIGGFNRFDLTCLGLAVIGLIGWQLSRQPIVAIVAIIFADAMGVLPTIRKSYLNPESESWIFFGGDTVAGLLAAGAVGSLNIILLLYPAYIALANAAVVIAIYLGYARKKRKAVKHV